ncbi:hypothetical protein EOD39_7048 [Acipenser ruthenus]|uniref:Selenoprotein P N-terminal domain-containing protein n=1 Tax=Acipenser ruthenus TaxID=7906 RepID=A0A662YXU3_ACIRT|nr:hypothetical protein EOD39_7048 [Acipenser ruthenus]
MRLSTAVFAAFLGLSVAASDEEGVSRICQPAPNWEIDGLGGLRAKLSRRGLSEVGFLIVNEKEPQARAMYWELKRRAPKGVPVYQQDPLQQDVWETLGGDKDDFLIYDRCGKLTFHIPLPYSFLHRPYIEAAVLATYHKDICGNCSILQWPREPQRLGTQTQLDNTTTRTGSPQLKTSSTITMETTIHTRGRDMNSPTAIINLKGNAD